MLSNSKEFMGSWLLEKDVGLIGSSSFLSEKHPIKEPPNEPPASDQGSAQKTATISGASD